MGKIVTTESFIISSKKIHGDNYDYSLVEYSKTIIPVKIVCPKHGIFEQTPHNHLRKSGCPKCSRSRAENSRKYTKRQFTDKSNEIHNNKYSYDKVNYINSKTKVTITCKEHGDFLLTPKKHIQGIGCNSCVCFSRYNITVANRNKEEFKNKDAILYLVKVYNKEENFYKVGITTRTLKKRLLEVSKNYKYNVEKLIYTNLYDAIYLETKILNSNIEKYNPKIKFGGHTECFLERPILNGRR